MRRAVFALPVLVAASVLSIGCEVEDPSYVDEKVVEAEAKIIGGTPDTTHKAVVFLLDEARELERYSSMASKLSHLHSLISIKI
jgi:hypothetical protein